MKAKQTSVRAGVQDLLCPFPKLNITQGANVGSHKGIEAIDVTTGTKGLRGEYYAPCDLKVVQIYYNSATVLWHSLKPVRLSNGKVSHITILTAHDNSINYKVGFEVKQGQQMGNMGDKGIGTGVHAHIEQGYGHQNAFNKTGDKFTLGGVTYDIYGLKQQIPFEQAYFMDNTEIISGKAKWVYLKDVPVVENKYEPEVYAFTSTVEKNINIRKEPNTDAEIVGKLAKGQTYDYIQKYNDGKYIWVGNGKNWIAVREVKGGKRQDLWGTLQAQKAKVVLNEYGQDIKVGDTIYVSYIYTAVSGGITYNAKAAVQYISKDYLATIKVNGVDTRVYKAKVGKIYPKKLGYQNPYELVTNNGAVLGRTRPANVYRKA